MSDYEPHGLTEARLLSPRGEGAGEGGIPVNTTNSCKCRHCLRNPGTWDPKWSVSVLSFIRLTLLSFSLSIFSPVIPCYSLPDTLSLPCAWTASNHVSRTQRTLDKVREKYFSKICHQAAWEWFSRTILQVMNLTFDPCKEGQQICFYSTSHNQLNV